MYEDESERVSTGILVLLEAKLEVAVVLIVPVHTAGNCEGLSVREFKGF